VNRLSEIAIISFIINAALLYLIHKCQLDAVFIKERIMNTEYTPTFLSDGMCQDIEERDYKGTENALYGGARYDCNGDNDDISSNDVFFSERDRDVATLRKLERTLKLNNKLRLLL